MTHILSRRHSLKLGLAAMASPFVIQRAQAAASPVLVELFTSQGCSSCPPADKVLGEIKDNPNIYAVSLNVDYWDYLGWRDTLAKPEYTARQRAYASARGDGQVYTPQVVINGVAHAVGSRRGSVDAAIAEALAPTVPLDIKVEGDDLVVSAAKGAAQSGYLWLMGIQSEAEQEIKRGENAGESIIYHNVVRELVNAGPWDGAQDFRGIKFGRFKGQKISEIIAVLQSGEVGQVLGLQRFKLPQA
jgi:hypothetical protein